MKCPYCGFNESKVIDSRPADENNSGMLRACEKRPVPVARLEKVAADIEQELQNSMEREISTAVIGERVMEHLRAIDQVAYVRFASVYRQFKDIDSFMEELTKLLAERNQI